MTLTRHWKTAAATALIVLTFILMLRADLHRVAWAENISSEGSPPPRLDAKSPTGYELGQRHFISLHNRGETYRWIAYTQQLANDGAFSAATYDQDTVPTGRPQLSPKLYAAWLAANAVALQIINDQPFPIAVEQVALWEPLVSHAVAFFLIVAFMVRRVNLLAGATAGLFFALFPFFSAQFIPSSLSPETWALMLASFAIALNLRLPDSRDNAQLLGPYSAVLAGLALWLNPAFGFPAVLIIIVIGWTDAVLQGSRVPFLNWALLGSAISFTGWIIDQNPFALASGELRYNHPLYAIAWLGLGLGLRGWQSYRDNEKGSASAYIQIGVGVLFVSSLVYSQFSDGYLGWLYSGASTLRPTSLDETQIFKNAFAWIAEVSLAETTFFFSLPLLALFSLIALLRKANKDQSSNIRNQALTTLVPITGIFILSLFKIRWGVGLGLISIPIFWHLAPRFQVGGHRYLITAAGVLAFGIFAWSKNLPPSLQRPVGEDSLSLSDMEALVNRHLSHWMATHYPSRDVNALAPPDLSDSLIFHGNCKALLSSAWESYPGQVAASRVLSAPEDSEVQAIVESREITHLFLQSWDNVFPLMVQQPMNSEEDTFYDRLQRWVLPLYLRAIPYQLPPTKGFEIEKLAIFEMTPPQDDALSLSRLTEYFIEMRRPQPAQLAAEALAKSYFQDPNAQLALALAYSDANKPTEAKKQISELVADIQGGIVPLDWDRRVLRTIMLALAKEHEFAKEEVKACLELMNEENLYQLTSLQTFQFLRVMSMYKLTFPSDSLKELAARRCSEYLPKT